MISSHPRVRAGFTFIELLMVTAMAGIMMAVVVPRMRISPATEMQLAGMQLVQDIDLARTRALSTRSYVRVLFTNSSADSYTGFLDDNGDSTFTQSVLEMQRLRGWGLRPLPVRVEYGRGSAPAVPGDAGSGPITFAGSVAQFDSRGLVNPRGSAGTIYLRHSVKPEEVVAIVVSPSGSVRLWTYRSGAWQ